MDQPPIPLAPPSRHRRRITVGLTAVALLAGGGVAIAAGQPQTPADATATPTDTAGPTEGATVAAEPAPGRAPGKGVRGLTGGVLHGEYVVPDGNGGYRTELVQTGTIESVDENSLTVASADGFKRSYARTADTVVGGAGWAVTKNDDGSFTVRKNDSGLATGQQVLVTGTLDGDRATATRVAARPDGDLPAGIIKRFGGRMAGPMSKLGEGKARRFEQRGGDEFRPGPPG